MAIQDDAPMKMTFVAPIPPDICSFGIRSLSAYLKAAGHKTRIIFMPGGIELLSKEGTFAYHYKESVMNSVVDLCRDSDLAGVSFMTAYFDRAVQITNAVRAKTKIPVIWGGIHPSIRPDEAMEFADMVCVGEGEGAVLELINTMEKGGDISKIKNIWVKKAGAVIKNPVRPLIHDLNSLPQFDYDLDEHYIYNVRKEKIERMTDEFFKKALPVIPYFKGKLHVCYRTMADRGCPHKCTYCNISNQKDLYAGEVYFRERSPRNVVNELVNIKKRFPFIEAVQFFDDTFFARSVKWLEEFSAIYKSEVGLPFHCQCSPQTISGKKMEIMVDAGMVFTEMGIQTASSRIKEMYRRKESNDVIIKATQTIMKHKKKLLPPDYHIIVDNPWETDDDVMDTVDILLKIEGPYGLCIASLIFFPGTELYHMAIRDGIIKDEKKEIYRKPFYIPPGRTYPNFLIYLLSHPRFPRFIIRALASRRLVRFLHGLNISFLYAAGCKIGDAITLIIKGIKAVVTMDTARLKLYMERIK